MKLLALHIERTVANIFLEAIGLPVVQHDDRELIIGLLGSMIKVIPQVAEMFAGEKKLEMFKVGKKPIQPVWSENPHMLIVYNPKTRRVARGSRNCNICKKYDIKTSTCVPYDEPQKVSQQSIFQHDIGGCVALDMLPHFDGIKFELMQEAMGNGAIFHYKNGKFSMIYGPGELGPVDKEEEEYFNLTPYERQERDDEESNEDDDYEEEEEEDK